MKFLAGVGKVSLVVGLLALAANIVAQSEQAPSFRPGLNLSDQQRKGEYLFLQRCAVCHQARYTKSASESELPVVFKNLEGLFKDARSDRDEAVRDVIWKGAAGMPGWQYALEPREIDDLIAYLKVR